MTDLAKLRELLDSNKSNETHRCYWCREITSGLCDCNAVEDITTLLDEVEKLREFAQSVINIDMKPMREDFGDDADNQFRQWAQNRARQALGETN